MIKIKIQIHTHMLSSFSVGLQFKHPGLVATKVAVI
jgi:hypothetical protein